MVDELGDAAVELENLLAFGDDGAGLVTGDSAPVDDAQLEAGDEERGLPCAFDQMLVVELGLGQEYLGIGPVLHPGSAATALGLADAVETGRFLERLDGMVAMGRAHV